MCIRDSATLLPRMSKWEPQKIRLGVSACLLGQEVRYDGGHKRDTFLTDTLGPFVEWVPVCPEVEIDLGVPRPPIRLVGDAAAPRLVVEKTGEDLTTRMQRWASGRIGGRGTPRPISTSGHTGTHSTKGPSVSIRNASRLWPPS